MRACILPFGRDRRDSAGIEIFISAQYNNTPIPDMASGCVSAMEPGYLGLWLGGCELPVRFELVVRFELLVRCELHVRRTRRAMSALGPGQRAEGREQGKTRRPSGNSPAKDDANRNTGLPTRVRSSLARDGAKANKKHNRTRTTPGLPRVGGDRRWVARKKNALFTFEAVPRCEHLLLWRASRAQPAATEAGLSARPAA